MKTSRWSILSVMIILILSSLACSLTGGSTPQPTQPSQPENTPIPPQPTAMPIPSSTPTSLPPTAEIQTLDKIGPCANPLYPLIPGDQWFYRVKSEEGEEEIGITVDRVEGSQAFLNAFYPSVGITETTTVECKDGAILNVPSMMVGALLADAGGKIDMQYQSGEFAPALEKFTQNNWLLTWESAYIASGELHVNAEGESATAILKDSPVKMVWNTTASGDAAFETITVEAGTFEKALIVKRMMTMDIQLTITSDGSSMELPATLTIESTLWFEPEVGVLKQQIDRATAKFRGFSYPVLISSTVELVKFLPAP